MSRRILVLALGLALLPAATASAGTITGTPGNDTLIGTKGDDSLFGLAGNDRLRGGGGDDTLDGGPGTDDLSGGPGRDAATYADAAGPVTVTVDDLANDGVPGERDNVQTDIEDVFGGPFGDTITGSSGANQLDGAGGDDRLDGGGGRDFLFGGPGNDRIMARDGVPDHVDCGEGDDVAIVDPSDVVVGCEIVDNRPAVPVADGLVRHFWTAFSAYTVVDQLEVRELSPAADRVEVRCSGRGCPFKKRSRKAARVVRLRPLFKGAKLRVGTRIEVRITGKGAKTKVVRFRMRSLAVPAVTRG